MAERDMRGRVVRELRDLDAIAVENPARPGTPDVNFIPGWLELKWLRDWPKGADRNPVLVPHFTQQQRIWLKRRVRKGGCAYLLLQVKREWLLLRGDVAAEMLGYANRKELIVAATAYWDTGLRDGELLKCLRRLS